MSIKLVEIDLLNQNLRADNAIKKADSTLFTADTTQITTAYQLRVAPRFFTTNVVLTLWNEIREEKQVFNLVSTQYNGYMEINFNHIFLEGESYEASINNTTGNLIWRGKLYSTSQTDIENFTLNVPNNNIIEI
jgi:hypothetical protein